MDKLLTVIVQTSPIPSHPSTALLEALFTSFQRVEGLFDCRILIVADGCEANDDTEESLKRGKVSSDTAERYQQFLHRLQEQCLSQQPPFGGSVKLLYLPERHGSARAIQHAVRNHVDTPFVMICQHDNMFVSDVPLKSILTAMQHYSWCKAIHFMATATFNYVNKVYKRYGLEIEPRTVNGLDYPLIPLVFWYGRTHVARTEYYRNFVLKRPIQVGDHLEELLGQVQLKDLSENGMSAHETYGNYVLDQGREVLYHLSGRRVQAIQQETATDSMNQDNETHTDSSVDSDTHLVDNDDSKTKPTSGSFHSMSFTTARSCRALVPGLELPPTKQGLTSGKFRQKCFHCGVKGHSYRYCPDAQHTKLPDTETIDLSTSS